MKRIVLLIVCILFGSLSAQSVSVNEIFEAEHFAQKSDSAKIVNWADYVQCGIDDWISYSNVNFLDGDFDTVSAILSANWDMVRDGIIEVRLGSRTGTLAATITGVNRTDYNPPGPKPFSAALAHVTGVHDVYLIFKGNVANSYTGLRIICNLDKVAFRGSTTLSPGDAATYFVARYGSDTQNDGLSIDRPFRTVQRAADVMKPGSRCYIRSGIYRETVRPAYTGISGAPLTFEAYNGESAIITGADSVGGWTQHAGSIYKAPMKWSVGEYRDQVFCNGAMMWMARCPDVDDICRRVEMWPYFMPTCQRNRQGEIFPLLLPMRLGAGTETPRVDKDTFRAYDQYLWGWEEPSCMLSKPANYFKDGLITVFSSWYATVGRVTSSRASVNPTPTKEGSVQFYADRYALQRSGAGTGFVSHVFDLLDAPNEWFWKDSMLYLYTPNGQPPSGHLIEAKRRQVVFNLDGKQFVNLVGLKIMSGSITMSSAENCLIDNCRMKYVSHFDAFTNGESNMHWDPAWDSAGYDPSAGWKGLYISGKNNTVRHTSIAYSAGSGIIIDGKDNTVDNCRIHDCNYTVTYDAGITIWGGKGNSIGHDITNTSFYNMGRSAIHFAFAQPDPSNPTVIRGCDFRLSGINAYESGHIYCYGGAGSYTDVSQCWFHDQSGGGNGHITLDFGHTNWRIHHNVFWNGDRRLEAQTLFCSICADTSAGDLVYNNTVYDSSVVGECWWDTTNRWADSRERIVYNWGFNNLMATGDSTKWKFGSVAGSDFTLRTNSPAIDRGRQIPGVTLSHQGGAPDLGAYEFGQAAWQTPGADWAEEVWTYPPAVVGPGQLVSVAVSTHVGRALLRVMPAQLVLTGMSRMQHVALFDVKGAQRRSVLLNGRDGCVLDIRDMSSGVYLLRAFAPGSVRTWRVVVR